jgi:hypothetical protein
VGASVAGATTASVGEDAGVLVALFPQAANNPTIKTSIAVLWTNIPIFTYNDFIFYDS